MANTRELSQLASLINVIDASKSIGVVTSVPDAKVGVGTALPTSKVHVSGDAYISGVVTATSFIGDGSGLQGIVSGIGINSNGTTVGTGATILNFVGTSVTSITVGSGIATVNFKDSSGVNGIEIVDNISSQFNGVTTSFALTASGSPLSPYNAQQLIVSLGGVVQSPITHYTLSGSNIVFTSAPSSGLDFSAVSIGVTVGLNVPADGSVTLPKIASGVLGVGIQSASNVIGYGITTLNFVGSGNTFAINGSRVDISISGGSQVSIGTQAPISPNEGSLWYNSNLGRTFIYYNDGDSTQWVDAAPFNIPNPPAAPAKNTTTFTATAGQTSFSVIYEIGFVEVYLNGIRLSSSEYTAASGTSIILTEGASEGDILDVVEFLMGKGDQGDQGNSGPLSPVVAITTNSTYYPLFVSGIGTVDPYITTANDYFEFNPSSGTLFTNQLNVTGVVTASNFVGNVTGTATNAQELTGTPNITVGNITSGNINSSGVITATTFNGTATTANTLATNATGTNLSVTGVVTASSFVGNGSGLTGISAGLSTSKVASLAFFFGY